MWRLSKKQFYSTAIFLILFIIPAMGAFTQSGIECGDANEDGVVDIVDALVVAGKAIGIEETPFNEWAANVNADGTSDIVDALMIARFYVGLESRLQCTGQTATVSHMRGIQCGVTYYESLEDAVQYLESEGIPVLAAQTKSVPVITVCGASSGITYVCTINASDQEAAWELGWGPGWL